MKYTVWYEGPKKYANDRFDGDFTHSMGIDGTKTMQALVDRMTSDSNVKWMKVFADTHDYLGVPFEMLPCTSENVIPLYEKRIVDGIVHEAWSLTGQKSPRTCSKDEALAWIEEYEKAASIGHERHQKEHEEDADDVFSFLLPDEDIEWSIEELLVAHKIEGAIMHVLEEAETKGKPDVAKMFFDHYLNGIDGEEEDIENARYVMDKYFSSLYNDFKKEDRVGQLVCEYELRRVIEVFFTNGEAPAWRVQQYCKRKPLWNMYDN
jgi:hypothetical protein|nr:MAG TPA: hypothetical protein [Caudoviricetes sp.]